MNKNQRQREIRLTNEEKKNIDCDRRCVCVCFVTWRMLDQHVHCNSIHIKGAIPRKRDEGTRTEPIGRSCMGFYAFSAYEIPSAQALHHEQRGMCNVHRACQLRKFQMVFYRFHSIFLSLRRAMCFSTHIAEERKNIFNWNWSIEAALVLPIAFHASFRVFCLQIDRHGAS